MKKIAVITFLSFVFISQVSEAQVYSEIIESERSYIDHLGTINGKELYAYSEITKNKLVLEFREANKANKLTSSIDLKKEGSRISFPKVLNDRIFVVYHVEGNPNYAVNLVELDENFKEIKTTELLTNPNNGESFNLNYSWFDVNEKGVVLFEFDSKNNKASKVAYRFDDESINRMDLEIGKNKFAAITQGLIDDELNLYLLFEEHTVVNWRKSFEVYLFTFNDKSAHFIKIEPVDDMNICRRGFRLFFEDQKVNLICIELDLGSKSINNNNYKLKGYRLFNIDDDFSKLVDNGVIGISDENYNDAALWDECTYKAYNKKYLKPLVYQKIIDVRRVNENFIITSMAEHNDYESGGSTSNSTNYYTHSDFIVSRIDLSANQLLWTIKTKDRAFIHIANIDQVYAKFPFYESRNGTDQKECFISSTDKWLFLFYTDVKEYKKDCFKGDVKAAKKQDPNSGFSVSTGHNVGRYARVNLLTGEIEEKPLSEIIPDADNLLRFMLLFSACRDESEGMRLLVQSNLFYSKGQAQEVFIQYSDLVE